MPQVLITESYLDNIADAIRYKNGTQETYTPSEMAPAIRALNTTGTGYVLPSGTLEITENGTYDVTLYENAHVNFQSIVAQQGTVTRDANNMLIFSPETGLIAQSKTVTPNTTIQVITPDNGYDTLTSVTINPVVLQTKTATPSDTAQNIVCDSGYHGLSSVTVNAVDTTVYMHISDANTYYTGTTEPDANLGAVGDIYLKVAP